MGKVLLEMGDMPEAGRYFFASENREKEYQEAINLFLTRYKKSNWRVLYNTLPKPMKSINISNLPKSIFEELKERGYDVSDKQCRSLLEIPYRSKFDKIKDDFIALFIFIFISWLLVCLLVGIFVTLKWFCQFFIPFFAL